MMQKDGKVRTLATPTLLTANNEVSRIFSGKEYPLVTGWTRSETVVSADAPPIVGSPTVQIEKKDVGTMLLITPNINADKTVTLRLLQENALLVNARHGAPHAVEIVHRDDLPGERVVLAASEASLESHRLQAPRPLLRPPAAALPRARLLRTDARRVARDPHRIAFLTHRASPPPAIPPP